MTTDPTRDVRDATALREVFTGFRARLVTEPLSDFSRRHLSHRIFCEVQPETVQELSGIVRRAAEKGIFLRIRGNGHALNGSSLPRRGELLVRTQSLTHTQDPLGGVMSAGAGCVLWYLDAWLRSNCYALPVINAGRAGPTVGGFVAAGGFGRNSAAAGGFWSNVAELTLVEGHGEVLAVGRNDPLFPWLFGSMGELGIVAEAKLDVVTPGSAPLRDEGSRRAGVLLDSKQSGHGRDEAGRLFWFSLFVGEAHRDEACAVLDKLEMQHPDSFNLRERYAYRIVHRGVVAPLVWPEQTSCHAVGSWGLLRDATPDRMDRVVAFDTSFMQAARANGYRRYVQSEIPSGPSFYRTYFGEEIYAAFRAKKAALDPHGLFNTGWVFPTVAKC